MCELPEDVDRLIEGFSQRVFDWTKFLTTESAEKMESAKTSLRQAIFDEMVLQREMGREEGYVEWDDDDPVGRFLKVRHDAEYLPNTNRGTPYVALDKVFIVPEDDRTPFLDLLKDQGGTITSPWYDWDQKKKAQDE